MEIDDVPVVAGNQEDVLIAVALEVFRGVVGADEVLAQTSFGRAIDDVIMEQVEYRVSLSTVVVSRQQNVDAWVSRHAGIELPGHGRGNCKFAGLHAAVAPMMEAAASPPASLETVRRRMVWSRDMMFSSD